MSEVNYRNFCKQLKNALAAAETEKDVENAYRRAFSDLLPEAEAWSSPFGVDGLLVFEPGELSQKGGSILAEFKWDINLASTSDRAKVIAQLLYYLKAFDQKSKQARKLPAVLFIGDVNEFFLLPTKPLLPYLDEPTQSEGGAWDWNVAPSSAYTQSALILRLASDDALKPSWVWHPQESSFTANEARDLRKKALALVNSTDYRVGVNASNILSIFERWRATVLHKTSRSGKKALSAQEQVNVFMTSLLDRDKVYQHPTRKTSLIVEGRDEPIRIEKGAHDAFWCHFREKYTISEKRAFTAMKDRLVEEENRRMTGEFLTPSIWVDEAHRHLDEKLGADWRERYVVWDCSCGTANLTRDYSFKRLYLSTLNAEDVNTIKAMRYNGAGILGGAEVFQFDFLNDDEDKLPQGLRDALADPETPVLFLNNPPYGTSGNKKVKQDANAKSKNGISKSATKEKMRAEGVSPHTQLYTQFMYRMATLTEGRPNVVVGVFSKSFHLRSRSYKKFRSWWFERFRSEEGFFFCANEFADVSGVWGVCWNLWSRGKETRTSWTFKLKHRVQTGAEEYIEDQGEKLFYLSNWRPRSTIIDKEYEKLRKTAPRLPFRLTTALNTTSNLSCKRQDYDVIEASAGYFESTHFDSPLDKNQAVYCGSSCLTYGRFIPPTRIREFASVMVLRDLPKVDWRNEKDEFLAPDQDSALWDQWRAETLLYLPLCGKAEFSGLRDLRYPSEDGVVRTYHVKNHWALLHHEEVQDLADRAGFDDLYADGMMQMNPHRMVTEMYDAVLADEPVSPLARKVFEGARDLTRLTITSGSRQLLHEAKEELHLQAWDCGWKQTVKVLEEYHPEEYAAWKQDFDAWRDALREMMYDLGYLPR